LQDIKDQFDEAVNNYKSASTKFSTLEEAYKGVETAIAGEIANVEKACKELKRLARNFNLANELYTTIELLKHEKKLLTDTKAIETANKFISTIERIIDGLNTPAQESKASSVAYGFFSKSPTPPSFFANVFKR
jgi:hypothetical protein